MKKVILIELNSKQQKQYEDWCQHLKVIFGEVGTLTWTVWSNGIGDTITVTTNNAPNNPLDLTDIDSW